LSALSEIIGSAIGTVIAEHPKLFAEKTGERAQKLLVREIMKSLTREPKADETGEADDGETLRTVPASDPRAIAYRNLREAAGAPAGQRFAGDTVYIPAESDTPAVHAFAVMPDKSAWEFITERRQLIAWLEFFDGVLPNVARRSIVSTRGSVQGATLPWPWPPSKTGKIYEAESELDIEGDAA